MEVSVRPSVRTPRLVVAAAAAAAAATWFLRQNYAATAARRPGEFMNGRSLLTDRASITLSLMARDGGRARAGGTKEVLGGRVGGRGNLDSLCTDSRRADGPLRYAAIQVTRGNAPSSEIDRNNASRGTVGARA